MKKTKFLTLIMCTMLLFTMIFGLTACNNTQTTPTDKTIVDMYGNKVAVPEKVDRIVCVGASALRYLTYAGQDDKVVAIANMDSPDHRNFPAFRRSYVYKNKERFSELAKTNNIGDCFIDGKGVLPKEIIKANPDVIFSTFPKAESDKLASDTGIPVVNLVFVNNVVDADGFKSFKKDFEIIGKVMNAEDRCNAVVSKVSEYITDLDNRTKNVAINNQNKVYLGGISWMGTKDFRGTFANFMSLQAIHTNSIADSIPEASKKEFGFDVKQSWILQEKPNIVFVDKGNLFKIRGGYDTSVFPDEKSSHEEVIDALKQNGTKFYGMLPNVLYGSSLDMQIANAYYMGKILYPEQFADITDLGAKTNEIVKALVGLDNYYEVLEENGLGFEDNISLVKPKA